MVLVDVVRKRILRDPTVLLFPLFYANHECFSFFFLAIVFRGPEGEIPNEAKIWIFVMIIPLIVVMNFLQQRGFASMDRDLKACFKKANDELKKFKFPIFIKAKSKYRGIF